MIERMQDRVWYVINVTLAMTLVALALVGCDLLKTPTGAAVASGVVLSPAQLASIEELCQASLPGLTAAVSPSLPASVTQTATYAQAYCQEMVAGGVPATTDANTPTWLPKVIAAVKVAAQIAGVVLPLL
jgi:hypothetical protein